MNNIEVVAWDIALLLSIVLFLSTQNWVLYNLIIGFQTVLVFIYNSKFHIDYYKTTSKIY